MTKTAEMQRAERAIARAKAAGWERSHTGRTLLRVLAKRASGERRQLTTDEILADWRQRRALANGGSCS